MKTHEQILNEIKDYCRKTAKEIIDLEDELYDEDTDNYSDWDEGRMAGMKNVMNGLAEIIMQTTS